MFIVAEYAALNNGSGSSIRLFVYSDSAVFDKVSTAIRITSNMLNGP